MTTNDEFYGFGTGATQRLGQAQALRKFLRTNQIRGVASFWNWFSHTNLGPEIHGNSSRLVDADGDGQISLAEFKADLT